uniref:Putative two-pore potassium channel 1-like isoform X2 n=1 Tax=Davidia involucrata TaxID=16924 RepID=A0A5B7BB45_DAVIN
MQLCLIYHLMMANDDTKDPLLSKSQQCSSSSSAPKQNGVDFLPHPESIFAKQQLNFKQVFLWLAAYLGAGTLSFFLVRNQINGKKTDGILDAMYFCVVTMTTVGYGDLVPGSVLAKLLACIFVFTGMALVGFILSKAADYILEKEETLLVKAIHMHGKFSSTEILNEVDTNKVTYKFLSVVTLLLVLVIAGTLFLTQIEGLNFIDALYCVCATITTLGYGDKSFSTRGGRVFAVFWILISTICLAQFFLYLAELYTENRNRTLVKWVLTRNLTLSDLEAADLDNDEVVSAAEFIVYKLKEMGKISEEDISVVMEEFKKLDVDQSGTLTKSDLTLSEPYRAQS